MMTSVELDYTDNPALVVPSYTHQVCGALCVLTQHLPSAQPYTDCLQKQSFV